MPDSNPFGFREQTFEQIIKELPIDGIESHLDLRVALERVGVSASHPLCLRLIQESESFFAAVQPFFKVCKDHAVLGEMKRNLASQE